ncbi:helix-turn-helix domain-containing protein [Flagellimonas baculiformis]|uniref:helix-turn-helix domain-containing protein n=1 Tax=Flagellimonas baculiformis TaxID=3067310 RepID=UPI00296E9009|nr:helix-turn-helix domain-containing protein [Muricauda sp. D6]
MAYFFKIWLKIQLLLILLISIRSQSQSDSHVSQELADMDYKEMYDLLVSSEDSLFNAKVFHAYARKAKSGKDTLELAKALRLRSYDLGISDGLKSIDSAISVANSIQKRKTKEYDDFMALTYYTKANILYSNYDDEKAVEAFIQCFNFSKKINHYDLMIRTLAILANIKAEFGQESEAILLQRRNMEFLEERKNEVLDYKEVHLENLCCMARCFAFNEDTDSATVYINKGLQLAMEEKEKPIINELRILEAQINYYEGRLLKARDTLEKYVREESGTSKADIQFYLGMIEGKLGNTENKRRYFESYDSIMGRFDCPLYDNSNEVYQFLLKEAINNNEKQLVDRYLDRLVYYDSLLLKTQKNLREITLKKFDLPMQEEEKQLLGNIISTKNTWLTWLYVISGVMLIGLAAYYIKYTTTKKKLNHAMSHSILLESEGYEGSTQVLENKLDEETADMVLKNLKIWEEQQGFLDNALTQQSLAKKLNTNSSYLSKVVNTYKGQNFANYLKDLRITHAVNHLKENPEIVKTKSMIQIAEMYGFNSVGVFSTAFKNKIGVTPGVFFKQLLQLEL